MEKILKFLPLTTFCLYFGKCFFKTPEYTDVAILVTLGLISCIFEFYSNSKKLTAIENKQLDQDKVIAHKAKELDDLKTHVASIKMAASMKTMSFK